MAHGFGVHSVKLHFAVLHVWSQASAEIEVLGAQHIHQDVVVQVQQFAQNAAAQAAGLPPEKVFVHTTFLGGGFGRRLETDFIPAAVECAKAANKPVKVLWTREDDMTHDKYRPPARNTLAGKFDSSKLNAVKIHLVAPSITSRWAPPHAASRATSRGTSTS